MSTPAAPGPPTPIAVTGATGRIGGAVAAAVPIHELRRIDNNLEHIFMQLTHRQEQ